MNHFERRRAFKPDGQERGPRRTKPKDWQPGRLRAPESAAQKPPLPRGASLPEVVSRACGDKVAYQSEQVARNAATLMVWRDQQGGIADAALDAYLCRFCGLYHIGHHRTIW